MSIGMQFIFLYILKFSKYLDQGQCKGCIKGVVWVCRK